MLSRVQLFANPWTKPRQAPLSMEFSRQDYWSGLSCPTPGYFPDQGSNPRLLHLLHWQMDYVPLRHLGKLYFFHQRMKGCKLRLWSPGSPDRPRAGLLYRVRGEWAEFCRAALLLASDRSAGCSISAHGSLPPSWIECRVQHFCTRPTEPRLAAAILH